MKYAKSFDGGMTNMIDYARTLLNVQFNMYALSNVMTSVNTHHSKNTLNLKKIMLQKICWHDIVTRHETEDNNLERRSCP